MPVWKSWSIVTRTLKNQFARLAMIPYAPEPTQTTESFRQPLPNAAGDRPLSVEQLVFVSLWSSFNSLLKNVPTETSPLVSRHNSCPGTPVRVAERWGQNDGRMELVCESVFIVLPPSFCHSC